MKLYKILESIVDEDDVFNGVKYLKKFGGDRKLRTYIYKQKAFFIGGVKAIDLAQQLKLGNVSVLKTIFDIDTVPEDLSKSAISDVVDLPHYAIANLRGDKERIEGLLNEMGIDVSNFKTRKQITKADVKANKFMSRVVEAFFARKTISMFARKKDLGPNALIDEVISLANDWVESKIGCLVYYFDWLKRGLNYCKIYACTCDGPKSATPLERCLGSIQAMFDESMLVSECAYSGKKGQYCVNCPSSSFNIPTTTAKTMSETDYDTHYPSSAYYIVCENPNFWDIILEMDFNTKIIDNIISDWSGFSITGKGDSLVIIASVAALIFCIAGILIYKMKKSGGNNLSKTYGRRGQGR